MASKTAVANNYNPSGTGPHNWAGLKKQLTDAAENQKRIGRYNYNIPVTEISDEEIELHTEAKQFNVTLPSCPYGLNYVVEDGKLIAGSPDECFATINALEARLRWYYKTTKRSKSGQTKGRRKKEKLDVSDARKWRAIKAGVESAGRKDLLPTLKALKSLPAQLKLVRAAGIFPKMPRPTPFQKIEANFSPVEMGFLRKLLEGKDRKMSPVACEGAILEFLPELMAHLVALVRMRTGLDVVGCSIHLNSGKWHFVIWTSRVTRNHELCGDKLGKNNRHQMGRYGHWTSAIKSQIEAGYELPARVVDKWEKNKAEMARRYPEWDGLAIDPWLEQAARVFLAAHFIDGDAVRSQLWCDSQEEYCRWLRKVEPIKARREQEIKNAGLGQRLKEQKVSLGEAGRHGRADIVRIGLTEVMGEEAVGELDNSDFPVLRIADMVARGKVALTKLLEAAKAGWEKLVIWLKAVAAGNSPAIPAPVETRAIRKNAPIVSVRLRDRGEITNAVQKPPSLSEARRKVSDEEVEEITVEELFGFDGMESKERGDAALDSLKDSLIPPVSSRSEPLPTMTESTPKKDHEAISSGLGQPGEPSQEFRASVEPAGMGSNTPQVNAESKTELLEWLDKQPGHKKLGPFMRDRVVSMLHSGEVIKSDCRVILARIPADQIRGVFSWYAGSSKRRGIPLEQCPHAGMSLE